MNDVEERLRVALRDALGEPHVPAGLVGAAARHAGRIRHRRAATTGLVGAAAVATGGVVLTARPHPPAPRVAPVASATAPAPARDEVLSVVVEQGGCGEGRPGGTDASCVRTEVQVGWPGASPTEGVMERNILVDTEPERNDVPADVVVRLSDGRELTGDMEQAGDRRWTAKVRVPAGALVVRVSVRNAAGEAFAEFLDSPG